jgi:hypothetical protein
MAVLANNPIGQGSTTPASTSNYPAPFLAPFAELLADYTASELNRPVDIAGIMPQVAGIDPFTQVAQGRAAQQAGLGSIQYDPQGRIIGFGQGTGIAAYEPFLQQAAAQVQAGPSGYQQYMSPYQQDVIDEAVRRQQEYGAQQQQQLAASAVGQGAFGGGRYDVARGQLQRGTTEAIGKTVADLQAQNYNQAVARQQQGIANLLSIPGIQQGFEQNLQQGLGAYGAGSQAYNQSILNALQQGEQTAMNFPFQRIQQGTNIFAGLLGTPSTPGTPLMTDPMLSAYKGIGSLAGPGMSISNVLGDVVKSAGNILGGAIRGGSTPTGGGIFGGYDNPYDYYESTRGGDIYGSQGSF